MKYASTIHEGTMSEWAVVGGAGFLCRTPGNRGRGVSERGLPHADALRRYHARYPDLPILIPENGIGTENGMPRVDGWTREAVLVQHLAEVQTAVAEGIPVVGYLHWSLTDNYEWGSYTPRFGLYRVDALTDPRLIRHPTPAVALYRRIARHRGVTADLLARYRGP